MERALDRVWIDISNLRQANMLSTLFFGISKEVETVVTTAKSPALSRVLEGNGIPFTKFNGATGHDGFQSYGERILSLTDYIKKMEPDVLVSDLDPAAVRTAFGLGIPVWTFFQEPVDAEQKRIQKMTMPLCDKVFVSDHFPESRLASMGLVKDQVELFRGWNECYLLDDPWRNEVDGPVPNDDKNHRILVRPVRNQDREWTGRVTNLLAKDRSNVVSTMDPNTGNGNSSTVSVAPPPLLHDLYVGSGRMAAEFFILGKPVILVPDYRYGDLSQIYDKVCETQNEEELKDTVSHLLGRSKLRKVRRASRRVTNRMTSPTTLTSRFLGLTLRSPTRG
jgi:predicted glycosyltransferase